MFTTEQASAFRITPVRFRAPRITVFCDFNMELKSKLSKNSIIRTQECIIDTGALFSIIPQKFWWEHLKNIRILEVDEVLRHLQSRAKMKGKNSPWSVEELVKIKTIKGLGGGEIKSEFAFANVQFATFDASRQLVQLAEDNVLQPDRRIKRCILGMQFIQEFGLCLNFLPKQDEHHLIGPSGGRLTTI